MRGQTEGDRWWRWRWHRCNTCDVIAVPVISQWADPTWWWWLITFRAWRRLRDWNDMRKIRRDIEGGEQ